MFFSVLAAALFIAGVVLIGGASRAWLTIESPAVDFFAITASVAGAGAMILSILFMTSSPTLIFAFIVALGLLLPIPWFVFTFAYTGMEKLVSLRVTGVVATPVIVGFIATGIVFGSHAVAGVDLTETTGGLASIGVIFLNLSQWFALLYAGGLMLFSSGLLAWTFHRYEHLDSTTGTMLGTFGTVPWLSILFGLQVSSISLLALGSTIAIGFLVGACAALLLVGPSPLFERVPAAGNVGPETVIEELADLVVVTDREERIVEINRVAKRKLDVTTGSVLGTDIKELLHTSITDLQKADTVELESDDGRSLFEPTVSRLTDQHDHLLGYAVVIRDVTARLTRQQRLEVFNRVLRHNLRNDVNVIYGHSELIRSRTDDEVIDNSAETILQTGQELIALSKEAQEADNVLNIEETTEREISLAPLIDDVLAAVTTACPRLTSSHDVSDDLVVAAQEKPLRLALTHLVENAIEHNDSEDPEVRVSASYTPDEQYPLCISIADNGPGIPVKERRTIETGSETPLQHSTGIGLWIVRWVTTALGGELEFAERDPWGTIVSLNLPTARYDRNATESPPEPGSE